MITAQDYMTRKTGDCYSSLLVFYWTSMVGRSDPDRPNPAIRMGIHNDAKKAQMQKSLTIIEHNVRKDGTHVYRMFLGIWDRVKYTVDVGSKMIETCPHQNHDDALAEMLERIEELEEI
jgi:hypothetical protein